MVSDIVKAIDGVGFNRETKTYPEGKVTRPKFTMKGQQGAPNSMKEFKREKWVISYIKFVLRGNKIAGSDFKAATKRIATAMGDKFDDTVDHYKKKADIKKEDKISREQDEGGF